MLLSCQMTSFSDWLNAKLAERNISPAEFARRMNKDQGIISRFLRGERSPSPETIREISGALKIPPEEVFRAVVGLPPVSEQDEQDSQIAYRTQHLKADQKRAVLAFINSLEAGDIQPAKPLSNGKLRPVEK
jgi:transcriptional regulator with XRE-family HTH domain